MASTDVFKESIFDDVADQAKVIREKLKDGIYYGIPLSSFPNQDDAQLVIAYSLRFMEDLAARVEVDLEERRTV